MARFRTASQNRLQNYSREAIDEFQKLLIWGAVLVLAVATATIGSGQGIGWTLVNWKVRHDFPDIRRIDPEQVANWLSDKNRAQPVLLEYDSLLEICKSHAAIRKILEAPAFPLRDLCDPSQLLVC